METAYKKQNGRIWFSILMIALINIVILMAGALLSASLVHYEVINLEIMGYVSAGVLVVTSFVSAMLTISKLNCRKWLGAVIGGSILLLCIFITNLLVFGGEMSGIVVTMIVIASGCIAAILLLKSTSEKGSHKPPKFPNR